MWGQPPSAVRRAQPGSSCSNVSMDSMRKTLIVKTPILVLALSFLLSSCSPRDFLTRRLAADLISASEPFKAPQKFLLVTGVVSNKDYVLPERSVLQHHGWISATSATC